MKKLILTAAAAASLAMLSNAAQAQCMIYSEPNYQGAAGIIQPNDIVHFYKQDTSKDYSSYFRYFYDPSWKNNLRSSKTTNSCILMLNQDEDAALKSKVNFSGETPDNNLSNIMSAQCFCEKLLKD
jgi:hypothetical protein